MKWNIMTDVSSFYVFLFWMKSHVTFFQQVHQVLINFVKFRSLLYLVEISIFLKKLLLVVWNV